MKYRITPKKAGRMAAKYVHIGFVNNGTIQLRPSQVG
jgi:hypothetical protein